jgi:mannonate dehydratase
MKRRNFLKTAGIGAGLGIIGKQPLDRSINELYGQATKGLPPLKITNLTVIGTAPAKTPLVVVKVETSEPGLIGWGCASWRQRPFSIITTIEKYIKPFAIGRVSNDIEDTWQAAMMSSYFRNGAVTNASVSGLDMALWDIKAKRAGMPVYELIGGKCRFAPAVFANVQAGEKSVEQIGKFMESGYRYIRLNSRPSIPQDEAPFIKAGFAEKNAIVMDMQRKVEELPKVFRRIRDEIGYSVELMYETSTQPEPLAAINMCKSLEEYRPFFIEDPLSPEDNEYYALLRQHTSVPIAQGELFVNPQEWKPLIENRLIDFIRCHITCIGGFTPALKLARFCESFNVDTAWHGPAAVSPIAHSAHGHLDLATWNFGIQEYAYQSGPLLDVFPGTPTVENGFMIINEAPGWGVEVNEKEAARYPIPETYGNMQPERLRDGTYLRR